MSGNALRRSFLDAVSACPGPDPETNALAIQNQLGRNGLTAENNPQLFQSNNLSYYPDPDDNDVKPNAEARNHAYVPRS
jgi:hypothetical protein